MIQMRREKRKVSLPFNKKHGAVKVKQVHQRGQTATSPQPRKVSLHENRIEFLRSIPEHLKTYAQVELRPLTTMNNSKQWKM